MVRSALTGTRIRERRTALQLRQVDLARMVGVSSAYLNLIEHNRRRVSEALLDDLARALVCDPLALAEGGEGALFDGLREAALSRPSAPTDTPAPELDRIEEFVGRYPGWAAALAERQARVTALERTVEGFSERMAQDPYLADTLHEVLSSVTSLRSTAAILEEDDDIEPVWRARFIRTIHEDSQRLSRTAEALVGYLDTMDEAETGLSSPQEELEAWLSARAYHLPELEPEAAAPEQALTEKAAQLASNAARELAETFLKSAQNEAQTAPETLLRAALADGSFDPLALSARLNLPFGLILRRLAALPSAGLPPMGLLRADASGTLTFRKPLAGFQPPRFGAACPLWPLYEALAAPARTIRAVLDMAGRIPQRFLTYSIGELHQPAGFDGPALRSATMLILPAAGPATPEDLPVGASCRICPRAACLARREPSIIGAR